MIALFEFLYNNFLIIGIVIASIMVFVFMFRIITKEFLFNKRLNLKQGKLRNFSSFKRKKPSTKQILKVAIPLLVPIVFIMAFVRSPVVYDDHINHVTSRDDLKNIYESFHGKFYSMSLRDPQDETVSPLRQQYTQEAAIRGAFDYVASSEEFIFVVSGDGINIIGKNSVDSAHHGTIDLKTLYPETDYEIKGLYVDEGQLVLAMTKVIDLKNIDSDLMLYDRQPHMRIAVYEIGETLELVDSYRLSGSLKALSTNAGRIIIVANQYLPFEWSGFDSDDFLPTLSHDDKTERQLYSNIRYIEGTEPNNLLTIYSINPKNGNYSMETTLTGKDNQVVIEGDGVYFLSESYKFRTIANYMEMQNPVETHRTAVTKFNIGNRNPMYFRTKIVEGAMLGENAIFCKNDMVLIFNMNNEDTLTVHRLDDRLNLVSQASTTAFDRIERISFFNNTLYLDTGESRMNVLDFGATEITLQAGRTTALMPENVIFSEQNAFLVGMDIRSDYVAVTIFQQAENGHEPLFENRLMRTSYRLSYFSDYYRIKDMPYIDEKNLLLFPTISMTQQDKQINFYTSLSIYDFDKETLSFTEIDSIDLPAEIHNMDPFVYRTVFSEEAVYHITPSGVAVTSTDDLVSVLHLITFDSE